MSSGVPHQASGDTVAGRRGLSTVLALPAIVALAAWLRIHHLGGRGLWQDEAYSFVFAIMPAGKFWKLMWGREGNMLLYYVLLRAWVQVGTSEFVLRLPSVIFAVASVGMIYALGKGLFSKSAGLMAAVLLSVHMLDIFVSQNARSYTLTVFLLTASSLAFAGLVRCPERKTYQIAYPLLAALAIYGQLLAILVIGSQWLSLDRTRLRSIGWRRWLGILAAIFVLALPMEAFALLKNKGQLNWIPPLSWHTFMEGMYALSGYGGMTLLLLYALLIVMAVAGGFRCADGEYRFGVKLIGMWLGLPVMAMVLYSFHKPLFYSRFLILCVPAVTLLAAQGLMGWKTSSGWTKWLCLPVLLATIVLSLRSDWNYYRSAMWPDWKNATSLVLAHARSDDAICFSGNGAEVFLYYMQHEQNTPWNQLPEVYYSHGVRCLGKMPEQISDSGYARVWLLKTDSSEEQYQWIAGLLRPHYRWLRSVGTFPSPPGQIVVNLLEDSKK